MKLQEAIEIGQDLELSDSLDLEPDEKHALKLLIEAGKRCQLARKETSFVGPGPLPGETK